ncbi:hypothetical protein KP509_17G002500 [Ceratopteris richardii]|uniref:V-type proton ATPase subunit a n=1 Tax=Ceratopteris richardii TaxID=49495 RepID=A0A8T2SRK9_CERRI|nr:hypothetical protein KP509_17G002500 [Ceratopteris richardii]
MAIRLGDPDGPAMDLFRSEEMTLVQLIIPVESAHETITNLGDLGLLQFKDLNADKSPFQRTYAHQVKRCAEMARKLRFFKDQMEKAGISAAARSTVQKDMELDELEVKLGDLETELLEINSSSDRLLRSYSELLEFQLVLKKAGIFFSHGRSHASTYQRELEDPSSFSKDIPMDIPLLLEQEMQTDISKQARLGFITGLIPKTKVTLFERTLFRATRGNLFFKQALVEEPVLDPATTEKVDKLVFVVFFSGERARMKVMKICEAFGANKYPFPEEVSQQAQMINEVSERVAELKATIDAGNRHRDSMLSMISHQFEHWNLMVRKQKAVYHTLNMLNIDVTRKCLVAEGWCPVSAKLQIQDALHQAAFDSNSQVATIFQVLHTKESPPTYFKTNKFTGAYQEIVDAYGIAKYQEANPGVFTIITFPFLFAVMFGDWGHGICLLVAVLWLIFNEKKYGSQKLGDIMGMAFSGRYVILLMAIFSIYTGLIYNEFFSRSFPIFGSSAYQCSDSSCSQSSTTGLIKTQSSPYWFGVDPVWHGSSTELPFLNSMKMKMSILLGVAQMNLGIALSYFNAKFFANELDVWYQFIPQVIFLNALFGYLSLLIIIKWCTGARADLYHVMIYMFLSPTADLGENQLFWGQKYFQILLLLAALVAVPWMLLPKPLILRKRQHEKLQGRMYGILGSSDSESVDQDHGIDPDHEEFDFGEVLVHQMIHTIEFVLGAVSNTASYLRLWALSLAHSELSAVFYDKVLLLALGYNNIVITIIGFVVFANATIGVLLCMETLSAFLHALRLHWVEFQGKFYQGDGYKFKPFSFSSIAKDED